jgi:hypothetical protein
MKNRVYPLPVKTCRFLRGIFRYGLAHIPKLDDAVALEFENVNYGRFQLARFLPRPWINRHQIPIFERAPDLQHLIRIPGFVFLQSQNALCEALAEVSFALMALDSSLFSAPPIHQESDPAQGSV